MDQVLAASSSSTSSCHRLVLFLSDGEPNNWDEPADYTSVAEQATLHNSLVLTYALGSGAPGEILKRLACENEGVFYPVADNQNLGDVMAAYYSLLSPMLEPCQVRFTEYEDWFTKKKLLSACVPAYKKVEALAPSTCSAAYNLSSSLTDVPHLIGVVCLDMQLIASDDQLHAHPGWPAFWARVTDQMASCPRRTFSESGREQLRARVSPQSVCGSDVSVTHLQEHSSHMQRTGTAPTCPPRPPPPPPPPAPPPAPPAPPVAPGSDTALSAGAIAGIAAAAAGVAVIIAAAVAFFKKKQWAARPVFASRAPPSSTREPPVVVGKPVHSVSATSASPYV